jgi:hypothetical protein
MAWWGWFIILPLLSPLLIAPLFCIPHSCDRNWTMHKLELHYTDDHGQTPKSKKKFCLVLKQIFCVCFLQQLGGMLARVNISTLYFRRKHLDALFLINIFKSNSFSSIFLTDILRIPTRIIRDFSTFVVNKISRSARQPDVSLLLLIFARKLMLLTNIHLVYWYFINLLMFTLKLGVFFFILYGFHVVNFTVFLFVYFFSNLPLVFILFVFHNIFLVLLFCAW